MNSSVSPQGLLAPCLPDGGLDFASGLFEPHPFFDRPLGRARTGPAGAPPSAPHPAPKHAPSHARPLVSRHAPHTAPHHSPSPNSPPPTPSGPHADPKAEKQQHAALLTSDFAALCVHAMRTVGISFAKNPGQTRLPCRAVFAGDLHLGTPDSFAEDYRDLLDHINAFYYFLTGDWIDRWHLGTKELGTQELGVIAKLAACVQQGSKLIFTPGNHDGDYVDHSPDNLEAPLRVQRRTSYEASDGKLYLVEHGDAYDVCENKYLQWLSFLGTLVYKALSIVGRVIDTVRLGMGFRHQRPFAYATRALLGGIAESTLGTVARVACLSFGKGLACHEKRMCVRFNEANEEIAVLNTKLPPERRLKYYSGIICSHTHVAVSKIVSTALKKKATGAHPDLPMHMEIFNTGPFVGPHYLGGRPPHDQVKEKHPVRTLIIDIGNGLEHAMWVPELRGLVKLVERDAYGAFLNRPLKHLASLPLAVLHA
jgi:UDP-2,3-diacylglucosamine pyrophosphatase LpxH